MNLKEEFLNDFALILSEVPNSLIEVSNTQKNSPGQWNLARYYRSITGRVLHDLLNIQRVNFGYLNGIMDLPIIEGSEMPRRTKDHHVQSKNLMVFDADFKSCLPNYQDKSPDELAEIAFRLSDKIFTAFKGMKLTPFYFLFSGHGLHSCVYLEPAKWFEVKDVYSNFYLMALEEIEARVPKLVLDRQCSNPARIFRLPFSVNYKPNQEPIATQVLYYDRPQRSFYV